MRVLITGASGLIGSALAADRAGRGDEVLRLVRRPPRDPFELRWDPSAGELDGALLEGVDAVVHLAGENIASGRWTAARKERLRASRVRGTELLARRLASLAVPPRVLVCASAIGYYGDRGAERLEEGAAPGEGFLPELCVAWEAACEPARRAGVRVVNPRIGVVLSTRGGALARMLPPFRLGLGGVVGDGSQFMSWIAIDDLVAVLHRAIDDEDLAGPVNAVAPEAVTNRDFTRALGRALGRPTLLPLPAFAARLAFGEMADGLLLASTRVVPARLLAGGSGGHRFLHPDLGEALEHVLATGC